MQERLKNALTAIGFCMLALVMTSVFATTVKAETNAELKNIFLDRYERDMESYGEQEGMMAKPNPPDRKSVV